MVDDVAFQLILCKLLFNPSFYMQRTHTISFHIYTYLYYHHHISYLFLKNFIPKITYVHIPVRLSIHDTLAYCTLLSHPSIFTGMPT